MASIFHYFSQLNLILALFALFRYVFSEMKTDNTSLKEWLDGLGKDRHWLAGELGISKRTLDNWFSAEFPLYAIKHIQRIDREISAPTCADDTQFQFSHKEWKELQRRAENAGYVDEMEYINDFIRNALGEKKV